MLPDLAGQGHKYTITVPKQRTAKCDLTSITPYITVIL